MSTIRGIAILAIFLVGSILYLENVKVRNIPFWNYVFGCRVVAECPK